MVYCFYHKFYFFILLLIFSGIVNYTYAQDSLLKLKEVKIIAQKHKNLLTPSQQITNNNFKNFAAYNIADAVRNFAGVNIKDYGGIGGLKTVSVRSLGANHTGVLYDGVAISDTQNGQIDFGKFMLDNVETITLYNAQPSHLPQTAKAYAAASVIAINTIKPVFDSLKNYKIVAKFTAGSFGLIKPVLQWQQKINKKWAYLINSSLQKANGQYKYKLEGNGTNTLTTRKNTYIAALQLDASIFGSFTNKNSLFVRANMYKSERGLPDAVIFYNTQVASQRLWDNDIFLQTVLKQDVGNKINLLLSNKISRSYTKYIDPNYLNQKRELNQQFTQQEFYQSVAASYQINKTVNFNYAFDAAVNNLKTNLPQHAYPTRLSLWQVWGTNINLKKWEVNANVLNTSIKENVENGENSPSRSVWVPTIIFLYKPNSQINYRVFYKNIFRYPTFNDLYYTNFGNRNLNPELVQQYNLGATYNIINKQKLNYISLSADAYHNYIKNKIIALPNKDLFIWSIYNIGKVAIYGLDFTSHFKYKLNINWDAIFTGNYTYQFAIDVTDAKSNTFNNQLPYTPKHTFSNNVGFKNSKWGFFYNQIFSSDRYYLGDNSPEYLVKGFLISDVSTTYNFKIAHTALSSSLEIINIFNQQYSVIRSFPMPGTSIRLTIKSTF